MEFACGSAIRFDSAPDTVLLAIQHHILRHDERIVSLDVSLLTPHPDDPFRHYSDAKLREKILMPTLDSSAMRIEEGTAFSNTFTFVPKLFLV